jgi:CBS domain containing-hemolysin-like protein
MVSQILTIVLLIFLSGIFSSTETAFTSISLIKAKELENSDRKSARLAAKLLQDKDTLLTTILIGNNVVNISASSLVTTFCLQFFGSGLVAAGTGILTVIILIFGEITPKQLAITHSMSIATRMAYPIRFLSLVLYPFVWLFKAIGKGFGKLFAPKTKSGLTVEGIMHVVDAAQEGGVVDAYESDMMQRVLHFSQAHVKTIMTHRMDVFSIRDDLTIRQAYDPIINSHFSRVPIYHETQEEVIGIVLLRSILEAQLQEKLDQPITSIAMEPIFVPESKHVDDMFFQFKKSKLQLAVVLDEYGGFSGIVTMEDVIEQLFGELYDEHETGQGEQIEKIKGLEGTFKVQGDTPFLQFCDEMDIRKVPREKDGTVAAYLMELKKDIPQEGEVLTDNLGTWTIRHMDGNSIENVLFTKAPPEEPD